VETYQVEALKHEAEMLKAQIGAFGNQEASEIGFDGFRYHNDGVEESLAPPEETDALSHFARPGGLHERIYVDPELYAQIASVSCKSVVE